MKTYEEELAISIELKSMIGRRSLLIYDLISLFDKYDLIENKLDCWLILDKEKPFDSDIMYSIARCYIEMGDLKTAEKWYMKITETTTDHNLHLFLEFGELLVLSGDRKNIEKGVVFLERAHFIDSYNSEVLFPLVRACYELNDDPEYLIKQKKYAEKYLKLNPDDMDMSVFLTDATERED